MNKKKRNKKWLGILSFFAVACVGLGVNAAINQTEVKTASALIYTTPKCLTVGNTTVDSSTSSGCPTNYFSVYMSGESTSGTTTISQNELTNWSEYNITVETKKVDDHLYFKMYRDGEEYLNKSLSGSGNLTLYSGSLPDGEYEIQYSCRWRTNMFFAYDVFLYSYRFEVDKSAPTYSLKAGGTTISSGSYTNKQIVYSCADANFYYMRYKKPSASSYTYRYLSSYTVDATEENNGWWYYYAVDDLGQASSTVSVYLDTVAPDGTITTSGGTTLANNAYTNQTVSYTATDTGGISYHQYKKPGATTWATYTAGTTVSGLGWHTFRSVDKAGNVSEESQAYIDTVLPEGGVFAETTQVESGTYTNASYIKYMARDRNAGVDTCYVKLPGSSYYSTYPSGTEMTAEGTYYFYCIDKAQNVSTTVSITKDNTSPHGTLYADGAAMQSGSITNAAIVSFTPSDNIGVSAVYVKKPGNSVYTTYSTSMILTAEGEYSFYATDNAGNVSETYVITIDRSIPTAQLYVDEKPIGSGSYTNGAHIKFVSDGKCYVLLPDADTATEYLSGIEYHKPGRYAFYAESEAGTITALYIVIIDRTVKPLTFTNVENGVTDGDTQITWEEQDPLVYAPIESITINGKPFIFGSTIYTIEGGKYEVVCRDAAGNEWTSSFVSTKDNIVTETSVKQYFEAFDAEGRTYAFPTYEKALAFAIKYENSFVQTGEWKGTTWDTGIAMDAADSVHAANGVYYIYKKEGNADEKVAYFTLERLNAVIEQYAKPHVKAYYYWEKPLANKMAGEVFDQYAGQNKIIASSITLGNDVACSLDGDEYVGNVIERAGAYTLTIADDWGNSYEYTIIVVREAPTIEYALGNNATNTAAFDRTYYFKDQVAVSIVDEYDELAMFTVFNEDGEVIGHFNVGETYTATESGTYTVKAVNHYGETEAFTMIISRNAPTVEMVENVDKKKLEITVAGSEDKQSHVETLEIYKSIDGGATWILMEKDDYNRLITPDRLEYAFRTTATYKVVVTDEFRTGIDAVTMQLAYEQKLPEGELIGVVNGGYTNGTVKFEWTDEAVVVLKKDGEIIDYTSGRRLLEAGMYELSFENYDGYKATYTFIIDTTAPEVTVTGVGNGRASNTDVKVEWTEEGLTATLEVNGETVGEYLSGTVLTDSARYKISLKDKANNLTVTEFVIDKVVDYEINVNENGLSNSVQVKANEEVEAVLTKDGEVVEYRLKDEINEPAKYALTLKDTLGNEETTTFTIVQPLVQEFVYNFDDTPNFEKALVNGEEKRLNYGTLEVFEDGSYEIGVVVGGKTYAFTVTVDGTAPTLTLSGVENGGKTKDEVTLSGLSEKAEMKVYRGDTEIEYELGGKLTELGRYKVVLTDECGNVAEYEFEILYKMNGGTIALIIIGILVVVGIILAIVFGKKATYKKKLTKANEEEDEDDFEEESIEENGGEADEN